jgi:F0F1-type ATP synthase membrane subunit b/b'
VAVSSEGGASIDILHLIDRLEELVGEARRLPIGSGVIMDRQRLLDLVDQMRTAVPYEVKEAREILSDREEVLRQAHEDAAIVRAKADEEVEQRLSESDLVKTAQARAEMLIQEAQARIERLEREAQERARAHVGDAEKAAARQMDEADRYALEMLRKLEQQLGAFISNVRAGIDTLESAPSVQSSQQEPPQEETPPTETPSAETPQEEQEP